VYDERPLGEETPMTFQVGFVGNDGVLLASDRRIVMMGRVRASSLADKIFIEGNDLAYCCAGGDLASVMRQPIIDAVRTASADFRSDLIQRCQMKILELLEGCPLNEVLRQKGVILFARRLDGRVELWRILLGTLGTSVIPEHIENKIVQGDELSSASLFVERYFPVCPCPIRTLIPLAAHTIVTAEWLNPDAVGGLEIVLCSHAGFEKLPNDQIEELAQSVHGREAWIAKALGLSEELGIVQT